MAVILVISYPGEEHTDQVVACLRRKGVEVLCIDLADFPMRLGLAADWAPHRPPRWILHWPDGKETDLQRTRAVWWRRVRPFEVDPAILQSDRRAFSASETAQAINGMLDSLDCPWVNPREADAAAHHKPYQWSVAQRLGLEVPRTLITTRAEAARDFIHAVRPGQVVFKAFLATIADWRETRLVEAQDLERLDLVRYAPVIFQEYISGVDLRITVVGKKIFAAEIDARHSSYPVDMRMVIGEGTMRPVELPTELASKLLELQRRLGLVYGAVDMRRTEDGRYYFLEVNPAGQWLFVEQRTGQPIAQAHADLLETLAHQGQA